MFTVRETSSISQIGGRVETPDQVIPDLQFAYFLTDHISLEGQVGVLRTAPRITGSAIGNLDVGTIWTAGAAASVQYHVRPGQRLNPYVGAGLSYSAPISTKLAKALSDLDLKPQTGILVQAGVDYQLSDDWFGNGVVRYSFAPDQVLHASGLTIHYDRDLVFVGAGIGYRF